MADREKVVDGLTDLKRFLPSTMWEPINDALALLKEQENDIHHMGLIIEEYEKELKKQEAVVRCKDCIHYRYYGLSEDTVSECTIDHCENPDKEWFCADGERKEGR